MLQTHVMPQNTSIFAGVHEKPGRNDKHLHFDILQVKRCQNKPFCTHFVYCVFYRLTSTYFVCIGCTAHFAYCVAFRMHNKPVAKERKGKERKRKEFF